MTASDQAPSITRKGTTPIKVYCLPSEIALIQANAARSGLTTSTYLREVGMGFAPSSAIDRDCVDMLCKINADQARLGNLLKRWLDDDIKLSRFDPAQMRATIELAMEKIKAGQEALLSTASRLQKF